jgi:hypothetical protein
VTVLALVLSYLQVPFIFGRLGCSVRNSILGHYAVRSIRTAVLGERIGLDGRRVRVRVLLGVKLFIQNHSLPTQSSVQTVPGSSPPEVKLPGPEIDHSLLARADVKEGGVMPPLSHMSSCHSA